MPGPAEVRLREVQPEDLPVFFAHQADPEAAAMAAFPPRDRDAFDAHRARILADPTVTARTVVADGSVAGNVVSWTPDGEREVGYWIGREHWGRGIATAALRSFLEQVDHRPLRAHVARPNVGSIRVLEKCGFERVGESRGSDGVEEFLYELGDGPTLSSHAAT